MKSRVYYGEFSLDYWLKEILKKNIVLPEYQRYFVWSSKQIADLITSVGNSHFIPPVTLGNINGKNILIDGQQRLTSILLARLNLIPSQRVYLKSNKVEVEDGELETEEFFKWTFREIQNLSSTNFSEIKDKLLNQKDENGNPRYDSLGIDWVDDQWLGVHRIGYSYIVAGEGVNEQQQYRYFSTIFRHINMSGTSLRSDESREALYYQDKTFVPLFTPEFLKPIKVGQVGTVQPLDFTRLLAISFQYDLTQNADTILKNFAGLKNLESYLERFISSVTSGVNDEMFKPFSEVMGKDAISQRMESFKLEYEKVIPKGDFSGITEVDMWLFGLVYYCLIKGKKIKEDRIEELKNKISRGIINIKRKEPGIVKAPNLLKYVRERFKRSLDFYKNKVE